MIRAISFGQSSILALCLLLAAPGAAVGDEKGTFGWLENVMVYPPGISMQAKLDTGADSCSVHAEHMETFTKGDRTWIRFTLANRFGEIEQVARKIVRRTKVKKKGGGAQRRPVVRFGICLGNVYEVVDCNLVNRSHFQYPVLLGRNLLAGSVVVDSSTTFTVSPKCKDVKHPK